MNSFAFVAPALANPITRQKALQNVQSFLERRGKSIAQTSLRHAPSKSTATVTESYYLFNVGDNAGYIIASGDDCAPAILGYADTGFVDSDSMPNNMKEWLAEYASQIKYMQETGLSYSGNIALTATHPAISPLLTTTWDQRDPYNQNCPDFFTYGKCVTGCVATAMAQVMYYHRANSVTATTATIPAYDCRKNWTSSGETLGHIHVDAIPAGSLIDWNNMLDSYKSSSTTIQQQAVANLMKYCGAAVQMDYADEWNGGSGAYSKDVPIALKVYFNYSNNTELKNRSDYSSDEEWDNLIYNELKSSRPVFYSGSNSSGGHAFVCDGYDGQGYYHINWGWSGTSDGFFLLSALDPNEQGTGGSSAGYNNDQAALINAEPSNTIPSTDNGIEFVDAKVKFLCLQNWDTNGDGGLSDEEAATVTDLGSVFKNSTITSFNELQYFTGLKTINNSAFSGCSTLSSIMIPNSVTSIGSSAFKNCSGLNSITIPGGVTSISNDVFDGCSGLSTISVNSSNTVYDSRNNCNAIIEKASNSLIVGCKNTIIPSTVTNIGDKAFYGCSGLVSITIPSSVTNIGSRAFGLCRGLTAISVNSSNTVYDSRNNCNAIIEKASNSLIVGCKNTIIPSTVTTIGHYAFYGCNSLTSITIPDGVTSIGHYAFNGCSSLTSITISSGVSSIGSYAFCGCSGLTSITIPNGVTSISSFAFWLCSSLTSITIPDGVTGIEEFAFGGCHSLTSIVIPESVTSIDNYAFSNCSKLASVSVKWNEPLSIGRLVFNSSNINSAILYVPIGTKSAYQNAICWKEFNQIVEKKTPSSNIITFADTNVKALCVQNWDTNGDGELSESEADAVTDLGSVFKNSTITSFNELQYFTGITSVGIFAFFNCNDLSSITLPYSVTSIGSYAFLDCTGLISITIPSSVTKIGDAAFAYCSSLTTISVNSSNTVYDSRNNCNAIIEKASNSLIVGCKNTIIPSTVTSIGDKAFNGCSDLASITIPSSVTSIGRNAFYLCSSLSSIIIPNSVTSIGTEAFTGCSGLISITIPSSVTKIGNAAFNYCRSLTTISVNSSNTVYDSRNNCNAIIEKASNSLIVGCKKTIIPSTVTNIGDKAFYGCSDLASITIPSSVTSIGDGAFENCYNLTSLTIENPSPITISNNTFNYRQNVTLYVPKGSKAAYQETDYWKEFKEIIEQDIQGTQENIMLINGIYFVLDDENGTATVVSGEEAYSGTVIIPASVTNEGKTYAVVAIGEGAFQNALSLTSISIPSSVSFIGDNAFDGCNNLTSVTVAWETPIAINSTIFPNSGNATLHVPSGSESVYASADCWKDFKTIAEPIVFADNAVKALCLANWDADGDGVLYMDEAAIVTDLDSVFTDNTDITTFDELQYFIGLTSIGERAFYYCSNLTSIVIPDNVTTIGNRAFYVCSGLTSLHISANVTNIEDRAFAYCSGLESITVDDGNTVYDSRNDCNALIKTSNNTLLIGCKNTVIPSGVKVLAEGSFRGCAELKNIEIPEGVTTIGASAFRGCTGLESVTLPSTITSIGTYAFSAFDEVYNLTTVTVGMTAPVTITSNVFPNRANSTLYVPKGCRNAYKATNYWKEFKQIIEIGETVVITDISDMDNAFYMDEKSVVPGNRYVLPIKLKNNQLVMGYQFDLELPEGVSFALDDNGRVIATMSDRGSTFSISKNKRSDRVCRFVVMDASNNVLTGEDGVVMNVTVDVADNIEVGVYGVVFKNGELTTKEDNAISSILLQNVTAPMNVVAALMGDVNNDGKVSVTDVVAIVGYILGNKFTNFVKAAADLNGDGSITVVDVVSVINLILNDDSYSKANALFEVEEE